jgi:hypothetical protein
MLTKLFNEIMKSNKANKQCEDNIDNEDDSEKDCGSEDDEDF